MRPFDRILSDATKLACVTLSLVGCSSYAPKDIDPSASSQALDKRSLSDPGLGTFFASHHISQKGEWDLERLTLAALYFSPDLAIARAELAGATGDKNAAAEWPNPSFNLSPGYNTDAVPGQTPWILGYTLTIPVDLSGQRSHRILAAKKRQEAARFRLAAAAWSARSAVRQALSEMHASESSAKTWRALLPAIANARKALASQTTAGEISRAEAAQVRLTLDRAELASRDADRARRNAASRLAETIGIPLSALNAQTLSYRGLGSFGRPPRADQARLWAAQHRADLLAALSEYSATQDDLQAEISRQYPDLSIGPGYQLDQGAGKWSLGLDLSLPLFNRNGGAIAAAEAKRSAEAARFQGLQMKILAEVDRTAGAYASAVADLNTLGSMDADLIIASKHLAAQEKAGELSALEAARLLMEQADAVVSTQAARQRAEQSLAALESAVQRPLPLLEPEPTEILTLSSNKK